MAYLANVPRNEKTFAKFEAALVAAGLRACDITDQALAARRLARDESALAAARLFRVTVKPEAAAVPGAFADAAACNCGEDGCDDLVGNAAHDMLRLAAGCVPCDDSSREARGLW